MTKNFDVNTNFLHYEGEIRSINSNLNKPRLTNKNYKIQNLPMQKSFNILFKDRKGSCSIYNVMVTTKLEIMMKDVSFIIIRGDALCLSLIIQKTVTMCLLNLISVTFAIYIRTCRLYCQIAVNALYIKVNNWKNEYYKTTNDVV